MPSTFSRPRRPRATRRRCAALWPGATAGTSARRCVGPLYGLTFATVVLHGLVTAPIRPLRHIDRQLVRGLISGLFRWRGHPVEPRQVVDDEHQQCRRDPAPAAGPCGGRRQAVGSRFTARSRRRRGSVSVRRVRPTRAQAGQRPPPPKDSRSEHVTDTETACPPKSVCCRGRCLSGDRRPSRCALPPAHVQAAAGRPSREPRPGCPASSRLVRPALGVSSSVTSSSPCRPIWRRPPNPTAAIGGRSRRRWPCPCPSRRSLRGAEPARSGTGPSDRGRQPR
ncbi:hypothetical protein SHL15_0122 [Streptomyces hygroscopicus subsp. limoneus]|nr:hypothetical protein SHL15_0122 [Streptomyces hygroscopicus subsp. limoneus]